MDGSRLINFWLIWFLLVLSREWGNDPQSLVIIIIIPFPLAPVRIANYPSTDANHGTRSPHRWILPIDSRYVWFIKGPSDLESWFAEALPTNCSNSWWISAVNLSNNLSIIIVHMIVGDESQLLVNKIPSQLPRELDAYIPIKTWLNVKSPRFSGWFTSAFSDCQIPWFLAINQRCIDVQIPIFVG